MPVSTSRQLWSTKMRSAWTTDWRRCVTLIVVLPRPARASVSFTVASVAGSSESESESSDASTSDGEPMPDACPAEPELIEYEAMGLTAPGEGERAIHEGWVERDGKLPVNVSGGLKAKGHPVGATGVSMHVMTAMQLSGTAPEGLQLPKAKLGGVFNMGGAAVANYVSILEPLR